MEYRRKHAASQSRSYYKKRSREAGTETKAERTLAAKATLKAKTLKPETLRKKKRQLVKDTKELLVFEHYKRLLTSVDPALRFVGVAWFRVIRGLVLPYEFFQITGSVIPWSHEMIQPIPRHWRFHKSDLTKNYHPTL